MKTKNNLLKDSDPYEMSELLNFRLLRDIENQKEQEKSKKKKNNFMFNFLKRIKEIWNFIFYASFYSDK